MELVAPDEMQPTETFMKICYIICAGLIFGAPVAAETKNQPYKGFDARDISSLSEADIEALQSGAGWGLALPAELNGYPGPAHVLELSQELGLNERQMASVRTIFEGMKEDAIAKGKELIEAERRLDEGFKSGNLTVITLTELIAKTETARAELRFVHLSRHLKTIEILNYEQIIGYAILRGYGSDLCEVVPEGHDGEMWRRHNACD
ncbi:hypothetical protein [uncultured Roseobacter sp.]|uniref:hypothetical protein n=1 Tax=uncultured Roseobacter sp. TaxID=114847 RepID=UPI0026201CAA|nr:hypothetical protein [uncultured Roseobacter sp.]